MLKLVTDRFIRPFLTRRFLKFAVVGASGVVVNLAFLALFRVIGVQINLSSALAIEVSLLSNFFINYLWTFRDTRQSGGIVTRGVRFHLVSLIGAGIQFAVFVVMNMVWLHAAFDAESRAGYHAGAGSWVERWLWHPLVDPPEVGRWVYLSQLFGIGCGMFWNYLLNFYWTFAAHRESLSASEIDR